MNYLWLICFDSIFSAFLILFPFVHQCANAWEHHESPRLLCLLILVFRCWRKEAENGGNKMTEGRRWWRNKCWCVLFLSKFCPARLISLFVIKNHSWDDIINLTAQAQTLNEGDPPTTPSAGNIWIIFSRQWTINMYTNCVFDMSKRGHVPVICD